MKRLVVHIDTLCGEVIGKSEAWVNRYVTWTEYDVKGWVMGASHCDKDGND